MIGDWHQITTSRMPYLLISNWSLTGWISLILPLSFLYYYLTKQSKTKYAQVIIKSLIAASSITLIHIIFGEVLKLSLVLQLQLLRIWLLPVILGYIAAAWIIKNTRFKLISAFLFIAIISNFSKQKIKVIEWPGSGSTQAIKVQKWLKSNTPHDALIIAPPLRAGFRIHSQRSIVVSIKDGSSGLYLQGLASSWHQRMKDVRNLASKPQAEIKYLKDKYNADYLVTFKPQYYPDFTKEFETDILVVYKL